MDLWIGYCPQPKTEIHRVDLWIWGFFGELPKIHKKSRFCLKTPGEFVDSPLILALNENSPCGFVDLRIFWASLRFHLFQILKDNLWPYGMFEQHLNNTINVTYGCAEL